MADERRIDSTIAVKLLFKGKNHQRLVDVVTNKAHAPLAPRPELRRDIVDDRDAALLHLPRDAPVERRRIDHDCEIRLALVSFGDQMLEQSIDLRQMAQDFSNADDRKIFRVDNRIAAGSAHPLATNAEKFKRRSWRGGRLARPASEARRF